MLDQYPLCVAPFVVNNWLPFTSTKGTEDVYSVVFVLFTEMTEQSWSLLLNPFQKQFFLSFLNFHCLYTNNFCFLPIIFSSQIQLHFPLNTVKALLLIVATTFHLCSAMPKAAHTLCSNHSTLSTVLKIFSTLTSTDTNKKR